MLDHGTLVKNASRGDPAALTELLQAYLIRLRAFVRLRMSPELRAQESASDLVQSVCREVLEGLDAFEYRDERQFRAWLFTTTLRKIQGRMDYYRAAKRDLKRVAAPRTSDPGLETLAAAYSPIATPSKEAMLHEHVERIENAFGRLPELDREVITLSRFAGLPHKEIAEHLGKSEAATRTLLYRALAKLARELESG